MTAVRQMTIGGAACACLSLGSPVLGDFTEVTAEIFDTGAGPGQTTYRVFANFDDPADWLLAVAGSFTEPFVFETNTVLLNNGGLFAGTKQEDFASFPLSGIDDSWVTIGATEFAGNDTDYSPDFLANDGVSSVIQGSSLFDDNDGWFDTTPGTPVTGTKIIIAQFTVADVAAGQPGTITMSGEVHYAVAGEPDLTIAPFFVTTVPAAEACCLPDGTCEDLEAADCSSNGGVPRGAGTVCATESCPGTVGACCFEGVCSDGLTSGQCSSLGGQYEGDGTDCANVDCRRRCCFFLEGTTLCADAVLAACNIVGGLWDPLVLCEEEACSPLGACCLPGNACGIELEDECEASGGLFQGEGTACMPSILCDFLAACCFPDGTCQDLFDPFCTEAGGDTAGIGTTCATTTCLVGCVGSIGDFIWRDDNGDGCQDPGEPGLAGIVVRLLDACAGGALVDQTMTDSTGAYEFTDLCAGEYRVEVEAPLGFSETAPNAGACSDEVDSDFVGGEVCVLLATNTTADDTVDGGFVPAGACLPGQIPEGEPDCFDGYVDEFNGGPNSDPPAFLPIACSDTICGRFGTFMNGEFLVRDTDFYQFTLASPTEVTWQASSVVAHTIGILNATGEETIGELAFSTGGELISVTHALPAGDWTVAIATSEFSGVPCGTPYVAEVTCSPFTEGGGCCFDDGSCENLMQADCNDQGGIYQGDFVLCAVVACPQPAGACCFENGSCTFVTEQRCVDSGGDFQGSFVTCAQAGCPQPVGACCFPDGSCQDVEQSTCNDRGGIYQGDFSLCPEVECQQPAGACCFEEGSCTFVTEERCQNAGGQWQGDLVPCAQADCPQPDGACCFGSGSCVTITQATCNDQGGVYQGDFTLCQRVECQQPAGACCFEEGSCTFVTEERCQEAGGTWQGAALPCGAADCPPPDGACCFPDGSCAQLTQPGCQGAAGAYQGDFTQCATIECPQPQGACCRPDGSCSVGTQQDCEEAGGEYQGDGSNCLEQCLEPEGACCRVDGSCTFVTLESCATMGGLFQGPVVFCEDVVCLEPLGACCFPDGSCSFIREVDCTDLDGSYTADGELCLPGVCEGGDDGACCLSETQCVMVPPLACTGLGGLFLGEGVLCEPGICPGSGEGACCLPDTSCDQLTASDCALAGGFFLGKGMPCGPGVCGECRGPDVAFSGDCMRLCNEELECANDGSGDSMYSFELENLSGVEVHWVFLVAPEGFTVEPDVIHLVPPLPDGERVALPALRISGAAGSEAEACLTLVMADEFVQECCSGLYCVTLEPCCADIEIESTTCVEDDPTTFRYSFLLRNLSGEVLEHLFVVDPSDTVTIEPDSFDLPSVEPGSPVFRSVFITGAAGLPELCLRFSVHGENLVFCCSIDHCFTPPVCAAEPACVEDLDGNGAVSFTDLLSMLSAWGPCVDCPEDLTADGEVGFPDLLQLLVVWGPCP